MRKLLFFTFLVFLVFNVKAVTFPKQISKVKAVVLMKVFTQEQQVVASDVVFSAAILTGTTMQVDQTKLVVNALKNESCPEVQPCTSCGDVLVSTTTENQQKMLNGKEKTLNYELPPPLMAEQLVKDVQKNGEALLLLPLVVPLE